MSWRICRENNWSYIIRIRDGNNSLKRIFLSLILLVFDEAIEPKLLSQTNQ
ncbi:hypothetical protein SSUD12_0319 [Streptococcus suis D12]|uniref:Uncharacterized protein n=1 Tax=Streptococcus suis D12 TaxID=1004952 RepID=G7SDG6_STRSU|nr:hypothetical protein SSUD12_0319 [Streptococcus suis D12]